MKPEISIFDEADQDAEAAADARAEADIAAGRVISHEAMTRWLLSLDSEKPSPPPRCGE